MISCLLAYDAAGNVVATLDYVVGRDEHGNVTGLIDFAAHEESGGKLRDIWVASEAVGSGTWPEWLGISAHQFTVELDGTKRITALVHATSGHRRERAAIETAIDATPIVDGVKDIRHLVGGPGKPLILEQDGRNSSRKPSGTPAHLPLIGR